MRVVVAPDSFKGTCSAVEAADALARGWRAVRPDDDLVLLPLADGGEGTLDAVHRSTPGSRLVPVGPVTGPTGAPVESVYLLTPDGTAVVELATASGLHLAVPADALAAGTRGCGQTVRTAMEAGARRVVLAVGGSASTDGGSGLLRALGLRLLDDSGQELADGGGALARLASVDGSALLLPPPGGGLVLVDVDAPLLGPEGAAAVFGPQKGADPQQVALLEAGLRRWAELSGGDPQAPGAGAAGGTAYGVATWWGAALTSGALHVARLVGLADRLRGADLVLTGEGRFDVTSRRGKVTGTVLDLAAAAGVHAVVVAGSAASGAAADVLTLEKLAGTTAAATAEPQRWLTAAGARLARRAGEAGVRG